MKSNKTMLKIIRLEQKTASRNYEIDNRYKSISCKYCLFNGDTYTNNRRVFQL